MSAGETVLPEAGKDKPADAAGGTLWAGLRARLRSWLTRWPVTLVWVLGVIAAFTAYLLLARTRAVNSDGASNALQAWDMLHGNPILRGWSTTDVSFYTTELPQYMLVELVRGLGQDVVHVAAAMTYTLVALMAALLAKGRATGREALVRVLVTVGIMLAPQLGSGVNVLISSPDHIGTAVPIMVGWLILDRGWEDRPRARWLVPVVVSLLLGWANVADTLVLYAGILPLVLASAIRLYRARVVRKQPLASQGYHLALIAGPLAAAALSLAALRLIHAAGGFYSPMPLVQFAHLHEIIHRHLPITGQGLLLLGGADFLGVHRSLSTGVIVLHLAGVAIAAGGIALAVRHFGRARRGGDEQDLVIQLLLLGIVINLAAYVLSTRAISIPATREINPVLPFGAVLAGRLVAPRLLTMRLRRVAVPVLAVVLLGYLAGLGHEISQPSVPAQNQQLTSWLAAHHLHGGLSTYWQANVVTLTSHDQVQIRSVRPAAPLSRGVLETNSAWYNPHHSYANFVVLSPGIPGYPGFTDASGVTATFGPPARTYHVGRDTVLIWNYNLLTRLH